MTRTIKQPRVLIPQRVAVFVALSFFLFLTIMPPSAEAFLVSEPKTTSRTASLLVVRRHDRVTPTKKSLRPPPVSSLCYSRSKSCTKCSSPSPIHYDLMVCRAVSDLSEQGDAASSSSESQPDGDNNSNTNRFANLQQRIWGGRTMTMTSFKERLLKASNWASFLCVLDCTILPLITVILPLFGIVAASPAQMEWLHEAGHALALWFVLPVGGLATTLNYVSNHRNIDNHSSFSNK